MGRGGNGAELLFNRRGRTVGALPLLSPRQVARELDEERAAELWRKRREQLAEGQQMSAEGRRDVEALIEYALLGPLRGLDALEGDCADERIWLRRQAEAAPEGLPEDFGYRGEDLTAWGLRAVIDRGANDSQLADYLEMAIANRLSGQALPYPLPGIERELQGQLRAAVRNTGPKRAAGELPPVARRLFSAARRQTLERHDRLIGRVLNVLRADPPLANWHENLAPDGALYGALAGNGLKPSERLEWLREGCAQGCRAGAAQTIVSWAQAAALADGAEPSAVARTVAADLLKRTVGEGDERLLEHADGKALSAAVEDALTAFWNCPGPADLSEIDIALGTSLRERLTQRAAEEDGC